MRKLFFALLFILTALVIYKNLSIHTQKVQTDTNATVIQNAENNNSINEETYTENASATGSEDEEEHPELTGNDDETTLDED